MIITILFCGSTSAQYSSNNYKIEEYNFGSGATEEASSSNYNVRGSSGQTGVSTGVSGSYNTAAGYITPSDEYLELDVSTTSLDFGDLSTVGTSTGTTTFSVRSYINNNYVIKLGNNLPTNQYGNTLANLSTPTASANGVEQFGINLVSNSSPINFGASPVAVPDNSFANAAASTGYNTSNLFKYVVGDTIAESVIGNGQTNFTISYITNVSSFTKSGTYTFVQELIVVPTF